MKNAQLSLKLTILLHTGLKLCEDAKEVILAAQGPEDISADDITALSEICEQSANIIIGIDKRCRGI